MSIMRKNLPKTPDSVETIDWHSIAHPLGMVHVGVTAVGVGHILLPRMANEKGWRFDKTVTPGRSVAKWLRLLHDYLLGKSVSLKDIPLDLSSGTDFQREVWEAACEVPRGQYRTYGQLAAAVERPGGARAVGQALGANPVPILVPCHRFIAADGSLGGFSAGLPWKRELLRIEGITLG
jgi:methylated-DNA-[protein]-cysteine S-methyltransferase